MLRKAGIHFFAARSGAAPRNRHDWRGRVNSAPRGRKGGFLLSKEFMSTLVRTVAAFGLALTLAACASPPPPSVADIQPPPHKKLDAKTQLETGHTY